MSLSTTGALIWTAGPVIESWHGQYPYLACELTFTDADGNPVEGVTLSVERPLGVVRHHRPIDDFYPGRIPKSDKKGTLRFHCCRHNYDGTRETYFFFTSGNSHEGNICVFRYKNEIIHTLRFHDLAFSDEAKKALKVTRILSLPDRETIRQPSIPPPDKLPDKLPEHEFTFKLIKRSVVIIP